MIICVELTDMLLREECINCVKEFNAYIEDSVKKNNNNFIKSKKYQKKEKMMKVVENLKKNLFWLIEEQDIKTMNDLILTKIRSSEDDLKTFKSEKQTLLKKSKRKNVDNIDEGINGEDKNSNDSIKSNSSISVIKESKPIKNKNHLSLIPQILPMNSINTLTYSPGSVSDSSDAFSIFGSNELNSPNSAKETGISSLISINNNGGDNNIMNIVDDGGSVENNAVMKELIEMTMKYGLKVDESLLEMCRCNSQEKV
jgi:hypothetical protein